MGHPTVTLDPSCAWDPDINVVAEQALSRIPRAQREHGGVLYKNAQGEYCYSTYAQGGDGFGASYKIAKPPESSVAGIYHSHPDVKRGEGGVFSPTDVLQAAKRQVPSFIRVDKTGETKRFMPGVDPTHEVTLDGGGAATVANGVDMKKPYIPDYDLGAIEKRRMGLLASILRDK